jgi:hypothetical protein
MDLSGPGLSLMPDFGTSSTQKSGFSVDVYVIFEINM